MEEFNLDKIKTRLDQTKSRKDYEKRVEEAREITDPSLKEKVSNAVFDTLEILLPLDLTEFKKSGLTKDDITRIDAELESDARKAAEGKGLDSEERKYLDKVKNSDLVFEETPKMNGYYRDAGYCRDAVEPYLYIESIKGKINGQDVDVKNKVAKNIEEEEYEGSLNGEELFEEDAKKIFDEYGPIAEKRMNAIRKFIQEKRNKETERSHLRNSIGL